MKDDQIKNVLLEILNEVASLPKSIDANQDLYSELGVESINSLSILLSIEERFNVGIEDTEFVESRTLNKMVDLVRKTAS